MSSAQPYRAAAGVEYSVHLDTVALLTSDRSAVGCALYAAPELQSRPPGGDNCRGDCQHFQDLTT